MPVMEDELQTKALFSIKKNTTRHTQEEEYLLRKRIAVLKLKKEKNVEVIPEQQDPEVYMNAIELITSKGYPCECHNVLTNDGYILGLQRIPHGLKHKKKTKTQPVVYLQHGLLGSSTNFLTNLANESLAYVLADAGYDVWLGNSRGNTYSRRHLLYPTTSKKFWAWSFDEMAKYDLPATLNYITKYTHQQSIYYIGHSQGTLIGFLAFSENEKLAKKNFRTKTCSKFDFGSKEENELHYHQPFPPQYNVTQMDVPVALYSGGKDSLADPQDVKILAKQLKNLVLHKCIEEWAHLEFIWGIDGPQVLFNQMMKLMKKF